MARGHGDRNAAIKRLTRLIEKLALAEVELSTSFGDPSFKLRDKALVTVKEPGILYLPCPLEQKELLLEMAPEIYYQTDHYRGWPGLLVRLDVIGDEELSLRLEDAWRYRAPKKLAATRPTAARK
jgi:hypothetical protein